MGFKLVLFLVGALSVLCFILMYADKKRAIDGRCRIMESRLFFISLIGGAIGCLFGMYVFRHKTKKTSFKVFIPVFSILHTALLIFLLLQDYSNIL